MQQFIVSHDKPPKELVFDVDAIHMPLPDYPVGSKLHEATGHQR